MVTNASTSPLIQQNQDAFKRLVAFVQVAEGLTIGIVEANFARDLDALLVALQEHPDCETFQFEVLTFADPNLKSLRNAILEALPTLDPEIRKKRVVVVRGLEHSIGMLGDYPPMVQDLNFIRDDLVASLPYPLLLCLPDYAITRLARYAPDFWAWKSGVFRFKSSYASQEYAFKRTLNSAQIQGSLDLSEKQTRINLLQRLLMEDQPSGHQDSIGNLKNRLMILYELGVLYHTQGEIDKAYKTLNTALALTTDKDDLISGKATILHELGNLCTNQGKNNQAFSFYKESLNLNEQNANLQGKAATLHCMAILYARQGDVDEAFSLYEKSLDIEEKIGDVQGKAATLHQMADIYASQGLGDKAFSLFQESLNIEEKIGDVQGKAATLAMMGQLFIAYGDFATARTHLKESLEILRHLESPKAETVEKILNQVQDMATM